MIYAPIQIKVTSPETRRSKIVRGAILEKGELKKIISLIDKTNSNGLKGRDAILLMRLKESVLDIG